MGDKLRSMEVFATAAATASFAEAAGLLGMSAVMVGKHVRTLEKQLGASLIERSTRRQTLTEIGRQYLELCHEILAGVSAADRIAETLRAVPQGVLRISAPVSYGARRLVPVIAEYAALQPQVKIDLVLNNRVVDLAEEAVDVAIRSGPLNDTGLVARPLRPAHMLAVASPAYLQRHGTPVHPSDLERHQCLAFGAWGEHYHWRFSRRSGEESGREDTAIAVQGSFASNNGQALLSAALAGMGVVVQADNLLEPHIESGELTVLLPGWQLPTRPLHIVRRREIRPSAKVRSFVDFALQRLG